MADNKSSLYNSLQLLLSVANTEQDLYLPPSVYSSMYNVVSSWLLTKIAEVFPANNRIIDIAQPFLLTEVKRVVNGYVDLPATYRNFLDAGIAANRKDNCECFEVKSQQQIDHEFNNSIARAGCDRIALEIVDQSQFDLRTQDPFDKPNYLRPIACFFGDRKLRVCPYDITVVEFRCLKNEGLYNLGYVLQPDDTWIYDPATTVESEWSNAAATYLQNGIRACYAAYAENTTLRDFSVALKQVGLS